MPSTHRPLVPALLASALLLGLPSCASSSPDAPKGEGIDNEIEARYQRSAEDRKARARAAAEEFNQVINNLDQVLAQYRKTVLTTGGLEDPKTKALERWLIKVVQQWQTELEVAAVADQVDAPDELPEGIPEGLARQLTRNDWRRPIAVAALGFSEEPSTLQPILNALDDDMLAMNACFALAVRRDPKTPPEALGRVIRDEERPVRVRAVAAQALYGVQPQLIDDAKVLEIWNDVLRAPLGEYDGGILVQALRGISLTRDERYADVVAGFSVHPQALVRQATALALGRLGDVDKVDVLLTLLDTTETNANVRETAHKALVRLAGGDDYGYDPEEWRRRFDFGG